MIVGIPSARQLHEIAVGWLNLAWEITIGEVIEFQEAEHLFTGVDLEREPERIEEDIEKYWKGANYKLNNAISLTQQAL